MWIIHPTNEILIKNSEVKFNWGGSGIEEEVEMENGCDFHRNKNQCFSFGVIHVLK